MMPIKRPILCLLALTAMSLFFLVDVSEAFAFAVSSSESSGK